MQKKERGSLTIEATVSLTVFIMVIVSIFSFINYCRVQAAVSNALDTTAKEMSEYSYFYEMTGLQKKVDGLNESAEGAKEYSNNVLGSFFSIADMISGSEEAKGDTSDSVLPDAISDISTMAGNISSNLDKINAEFTKISTATENAMKDPTAFMKSLMALGGSTMLETAKSNLIAAPLAKAMFIKHFGESKSAASEKLESYGVINGLDGLNFRLSTIFSADAPTDIRLVVYYQVDLISFLDIGLKPATMCKTTRIRAWLGGDAEIEKLEEEKESESQWSVWDMVSLDYGKYITSREKAALKSNSNVYYGTSGYDAYDQTANQFISYRSVDPYSTSYNGKAGALKSSLKENYKKMNDKVKSIRDNKAMMKDSSGNKTEVSVDTKTSKMKLVVVVPEDADMEYVNSEIDALKKDIGNDNFDVEVVQGYGKSPKNPANSIKEGTTG